MVTPTAADGLCGSHACAIEAVTECQPAESSLCDWICEL